jgi:hypothetical protein
MSQQVSSEEFKEYKEKVNKKLEKLTEDMGVYKENLRTLDTNIQNHVIGCGLDAYKAEMRERCERLNERIEHNQDVIKDHKHESEQLWTKVEDEFNTKVIAQRTLSGKIISTAIVFGIALIGVFGGINVNKVSQSEFRHHIEVASQNQEKQVEMLDRFIESYAADRIRREEKLDDMFHKQLEFNQGIMKNTSLLQQQLEVIKAKIDFEDGGK